MTAGNYNRTGEGKEFLSSIYTIKNDFVYQLLIYSSFLPINAYFIIDVLLLLQRLKWHRKLNEDSKNVLIHNQKILKNLRNVKIAVIEKNSIVDPEKLMIRGLYDLERFCLDFGIPLTFHRNLLGLSPTHGSISPSHESPSNFSHQIDKINKHNQFSEESYNGRSLPPSII